jgi:hypothetical protein
LKENTMKPLRVLVACCALGVLAADAVPARAAWDNVFQVCWFHRQPVTTGYYAAPVVPVQAYSSPCCNPCPQPTCTTYYVQRCYYQPVTTYVSRSYYEPVTTYRTSYYYQPVTTYRYSCYVDPCSGCPQQVAVPCTSYQLQSRCCPVQSWVQRCCSVPVTSYQRCSYWEPHTSCCTPPPQPCCAAAPPPQQPCCATGLTPPAQPPVVGATVTPPPGSVQPPVVGATVTPPPGSVQPPIINDQRSLPPQGSAGQQPQYYPPQQPPVINEQRSGSPPSAYDKYYGQSQRQPAPAPAPPPPPTVRLDRIVLGDGPPAQGPVAQTTSRFVPASR